MQLREYRADLGYCCMYGMYERAVNTPSMYHERSMCHPQLSNSQFIHANSTAILYRSYVFFTEINSGGYAVPGQLLLLTVASTYRECLAVPWHDVTVYPSMCEGGSCVLRLRTALLLSRQRAVV